MQSKLTLAPVRVREAREFVRRWHRRHRPPKGAIFAIGVVDDRSSLRGVSMVGRPVSRCLQDGYTVEVLRVATDGCPNACSFLYSASRRAAMAMGYRRVLTYTGDDEPGTSLVAAGWEVEAEAPAQSWDRPGRHRSDHGVLQGRLRWGPA